MVDSKLEQEIIGLIPSRAVKNNIVFCNHRFDDVDLVRITVRFSKYRDEMLSRLRSISRNPVNVNLKEYLDALISSEEKAFQRLTLKESDYAYDVVINDSPTERYLSPDFESALLTIDAYFECYRDVIREGERLGISIQKRKIGIRRTGEDIDDRNYIEADVDANCRIIRIYSDSNQIDPEAYGLNYEETKYPQTFASYELVTINSAYIETVLSPYMRNYVNGGCYFINSFDNTRTFNGAVDEACLLYLNSQYVRERTIEVKDGEYYPYYMDHFHLDYGYLEKVDPETLPQTVKDDYEYAVGALSRLEREE